MKIFLSGAGLVAVVLVGMGLYYSLVINPQVLRELREQPQGARAAEVMLLTLPDGRDLPVNYLRDGDRVFVGADGPWWRAFRDGGVPVKVLIQGQALTGRARTVLDDPAFTRDVFARLRPDVPGWLPDWLNARLVVIDLDG